MAKDFEFEEDKLQAFEEASMTNKDDILWSVDFKIRDLEKGKGLDINHSAIYYRKYIELLKQFKKEVKERILFDQLEPWWSYDYEIEDTGVTLHLSHASSVDFREDDSIEFMWIDEVYDLHKTRTRLLTVDQYAEFYEVTQGAVRQWIRRGKLRSAVKAGNEWRIPELAEVTGRGYSYGFYKWDDELSGLPEEYKYINDYSSASITQDESNKDVFHISLFSKNKKKQIPEKRITMSTKEKERFELILIGNPMVKSPSETSDTQG